MRRTRRRAVGQRLGQAGQSERTDYDVYVWDSPLGNSGGRPDRRQFDRTPAQRCGTAREHRLSSTARRRRPRARALYLEVRWRGGDVDRRRARDPRLRIGDVGVHAVGRSRRRPASSTRTSPACSPSVRSTRPTAARSPATAHAGPTNDGRIAPDISAACQLRQHASRLAELRRHQRRRRRWSPAGRRCCSMRGLAADPRSLGNLIRHLAIDRGQPGPDNVYGYGEFRLPAPPKPVDATPSAFVPLDAPQRVLDTRPESAVGPANLIGRLAAGEIRDLPVLGQAGVPASGVTAVAVNVTAVDIDQPAYVQALPTLARARPAATRTSTPISPARPGPTSRSCRSASGGIDLAVHDRRRASRRRRARLLHGRRRSRSPPAGSSSWRAAARARHSHRPARRSPVACRVPCPAGGRRPGAGAGAGHDRHRHRGRHNPAGSRSSRATVPTWSPARRRSTSCPGRRVANTAIVPVGSNGISVAGFFGTGSGHVVVDVVGYITSDAAPVADSGRFVPVRPARAFDSRTSTGDLTVAVPVEINAVQRARCRRSRRRHGCGLEPRRGRRPASPVSAGCGRRTRRSRRRRRSTGRCVGETRAASVIAAVDGGRVQGRAGQRHRPADEHRRRPDRRRVRLLHLTRRFTCRAERLVS